MTPNSTERPEKNLLRDILDEGGLCLSQNPRGTDKGYKKYYIERFYEKHFSAYRTRPISLMEIGFRHGTSLALWSRYFRDGNILGLGLDTIFPLLKSVPSGYSVFFYDFRWHRFHGDNCLFVVKASCNRLTSAISRSALMLLGVLYLPTEGFLRLIKRTVKAASQALGAGSR
jgi:hypothetical protein